MSTDINKLYIYLFSNVCLSFGEGLLIYSLLSIFLEKVAGVPIAAAIYISVFFYVTISNKWAKYIDKIPHKKRLLISFLSRIMLLASIFPILYLGKNGYIFISLFVFLIYNFFNVVDSVIHIPIPFLICNKNNIDIVKYRVMLILFVRGANSITPGIAILLYYSSGIEVSILVVSSLFLVGIISPLIIRNICLEESKEVTKKSLLKADRIILTYYISSVVLLNICFSNSAVVMLKIVHQNMLLSLITPHTFFFIGLTLSSIFLILNKNYREYLKNGLAEKISISTLIISLLYILNMFFVHYIFLFFAGLVYGINLQLVSTYLPAKLNIKNIFSKINYAQIANGAGVIISITWIAFFLDINTDGNKILAFMGLGGILVSAILYIGYWFLQKTYRVF